MHCAPRVDEVDLAGLVARAGMGVAVLDALLSGVWQRISRTPMTSEALGAAKRFVRYSSALIASKGLAVAAQVIMGRMLGAERYGELALVLVLGGYFAIPIAIGWGQAYVQVVASAMDSAVERRALKALLILAVSAGVLVVSVLLQTQPWFTKWLHLSEYAFTFSVVLALATAWWLMAKQVFQSIQAWSWYVAVELAWSIAVLVALAALHFAGQGTLTRVLMALVVSYVLGGALMLPRLRCALLESADWALVRQIGGHGGLMIFNGLVGVLAFGLDRLLINRAFGLADVGVYQAHFLATYGVVSAFTAMLVNYLFPIMSQGSVPGLDEKLRQMIRYAYPVIVIGTIASGQAILYLYGYPASWAMVLSFALFNAVQFHSQVLSWRLVSQGRSGAKWALAAQFAFLAATVFVLVIGIRPMGLLAGSVSLLGGALVSVAILAPRAHGLGAASGEVE